MLKALVNHTGLKNEYVILLEASFRVVGRSWKSLVCGNHVCYLSFNGAARNLWNLCLSESRLASNRDSPTKHCPSDDDAVVCSSDGKYGSIVSCNTALALWPCPAPSSCFRGDIWSCSSCCEVKGRRLTLPSSGLAPAAQAWSSFYSGPSPRCLREPLMSNVRPRRIRP